MQKSSLIVAMVYLAVITGCGGRSPEQIINDEQGKPAEQIVRDNEFARQLQGGWSTECKMTVNPEMKLHLLSVPPNYSTKIEYHFNGNEFEQKQLFFSDFNCTESAAMITQTGSLDRVGDVPGNQWAQQVNLTYRSARAVPTSNTGLEWFSAIGLCAQDLWELNKAKDVSTSSASQTCPTDDVGSVAYEMITIEDNRLYMGNNAKEKDATKRPSEPNRDLVFIRM